MEIEKRADILRQQAELLEELDYFKEDLGEILKGYVAGLNVITDFEIRLDNYYFNLEKIDNSVLEFYLEFNIEFDVKEENRDKLNYFYKVYRHTINLDFGKKSFEKEDLEEKLLDYLKNKKIDFDYEQAKSREELEEMFEEEN